MLYFDDMNNQVLSSQNIIYALHHDSSPDVYVGQTAIGVKRFKQHLAQATAPSGYHLPRHRWIRSLRAKGLVPEFAILEECANASMLDDAEKWHIENLRALGIRLLNCADGGKGARGYKHSAEACAAKSKIHKGKVLSAHTRALISAARMGMKNSPEARAKMSAARKGKKQDPAVVEKRAAKLRGRQLSDETKAKLSASHQLTWDIPGYRELQSVSQKTAHLNDPSIREKQSQTRKDWWRDKTPEERRALAKAKSDSMQRMLSSSDGEEYRAKKAEEGKQRAATGGLENLFEAARKMWADPVRRAQLIASRIGKKRSPEARARMSAARRLYLANKGKK